MQMCLGLETCNAEWPWLTVPLSAVQHDKFLKRSVMRRTHYKLRFCLTEVWCFLLCCLCNTDFLGMRNTQDRFNLSRPRHFCSWYADDRFRNDAGTPVRHNVVVLQKRVALLVLLSNRAEVHRRVQCPLRGEDIERGRNRNSIDFDAKNKMDCMTDRDFIFPTGSRMRG